MHSGFTCPRAVRETAQMQPTDSEPTAGEHALKPAIDAFLRSGNKSGNYRDALDGVLTRWRRRLEERDIETVDRVDKRTMANYARYLSQRVAVDTNATDDGISAATAWTYYDYVSAFLSYCVRWDLLIENPAQKGIALNELPARPKKRSGDQQFWSTADRKALLRHVDRRAREAVDEKGLGALEALRDRALVYVLAYSGVRGGEVLADPRDERRSGLRWKDVDLENNQLLVLGKNQQIEEAQLPPLAHGSLERLERALRPASDEWPVFVTGHAPSLYGALPSGVETDGDRTPLELLRDHEETPPSLSTNGGRSVLKRLCEEAELDIDGEYLKPHGARRGVGEAIYRERGAAAAQRALRHADPRTTSRMYAHIEASELAEETGEIFDRE